MPSQKDFEFKTSLRGWAGEMDPLSVVLANHSEELGSYTGSSQPPVTMTHPVLVSMGLWTRQTPGGQMPSTLTSLIVKVTTDKPALPMAIPVFQIYVQMGKNRWNFTIFCSSSTLLFLFGNKFSFSFGTSSVLPLPPLTREAWVRRPHWTLVQRGTSTAHTVSLITLTQSLPEESGGTIRKEPTSLFYNLRCWRPHIPWAVQVLPGYQVRANSAWTHTWDCQSQNPRKRVVRDSIWGDGHTNIKWCQ